MTNSNLISDFYEISKELEKQINQITVINKTICCEVSEAVPYQMDLIESISDLIAANDNCIASIDRIRKDLYFIGLSSDIK